jgi:hypothetical protein
MEEPQINCHKEKEIIHEVSLQQTNGILSHTERTEGKPASGGNREEIRSCVLAFFVAVVCLGPLSVALPQLSRTCHHQL